MKSSIIFLLLLCGSLCTNLLADPPARGLKPMLSGPFTVAVDGVSVLQLQTGIDDLTVEERSALILRRIKQVAQLKTREGVQVTIEDDERESRITVDGILIMRVTGEDAKLEGVTKKQLAADYAERLREIVSAERYKIHVKESSRFDAVKFFNDNREILINVGIGGLSLLGFGVILFILSKLFRRFNRLVEDQKGKRVRDVKFRSRTFLKEDTLVSILKAALKGVRIIITLLLLYFLVENLIDLIPLVKSMDVKRIGKNILITAITLIAGFGFHRGIISLSRLARRNIPSWKGRYIRSLKIKTIEILSEDRIIDIILLSVKGVSVLLQVILLYVVISLIFSYYEFTRTWSNTLFGYIMYPVKIIFNSFVGYIPNLFFIIVIIVVNRYLIKLARAFFKEIEYENIVFPGFHRDWADPTYKIVRFVIIVFSLIVLFPYLPGSDSEAFKGISIFLGLMFSLGSTSVIANIVSGLILTYMYAFKIGDRIKIGEAFGDVTEKTLLVTRVKTVKNEIITIPNSSVLSGHIINFSTAARNGNLILHTTITLGYDVPWKKVHETLIRAALDTENVLKEPSPFVLQTGLNDYYVSYELNAFTDQAQKMALTYSGLHQNIQDRCNEAGIEILSPAYSALRDGNPSTIPESYHKEGYEAPPFKILNVGEEKKK